MRNNASGKEKKEKKELESFSDWVTGAPGS